MINRNSIKGVFYSIFLIVVVNGQSLWACAICFGDPTSLQTKGVKMAVFCLLLVIGSVLLGIMAMIVNIWRRTKNLKGAV